jgi:hypothetical protein
MTIEPVTLASSDGLRLEGELSVPEGEQRDVVAAVDRR